MFWFCGHVAHGILAPGPGIKSALPALEGKVSIPGPPKDIPGLVFALFVKFLFNMVQWN